MSVNQEKINLEGIKSEIQMYRKTHTLFEVANWVSSHYGIKCCATTIHDRVRKWELEERAAARQREDAPQPEIKPLTLADFDDAALITELRKRGYRVYYDRFIKSKWGNHYKRRMVEAVGNTDNK